MTGGAALAAAFVKTLVLQRTLRSRNAITRWQRRGLERLRRHAIASAGYYRTLGNIPIENFPVVAKCDVMAAFEAFNSLGVSARQLWDMIDTGTAPPGYDAGCSTGTSGNRGLYLVSDAERFAWLGTILAKTVPSAVWQRHRVAVMLPRMSRLYAAANESRILSLQFFDLTRGLDALAGPLAAFAPTVIVAPPAALRWMANQTLAIRPQHVFSGAEVLDPMDRAAIERFFGVTVRDIYMATEGLFGVSCCHGTLHLAEDIVHFEFEPVNDDPLLVSPIVTDFTRRTQILARYRMNDILRLQATPCRCGSPLQAVAEVIGRCDDVFHLRQSTDPARSVEMTPDVLRNAILGADRSIDDFRVLQTGNNSIDLILPEHTSRPIAEGARTALARVCAASGASPDITVRTVFIPQPPPGAKLRRVEKRWRPA